MLSRKTEWVEASAETFLGWGQKMLTTDTGDYALMDIRLIELDSEAPSEETPSEEPESDPDSNHA